MNPLLVDQTMKKLALLSAACAAIFSHNAVAQNATTVPVGVMTIDFPATGTSPASTLSYVGIPLHDNPVFVGKPASVSATSLSFNGVDWTTSPSQFGAVPSRFVLRVLTGQQAGRILQIVSNTSGSITVSVTDRTTQSTDLNLAGFAITTSDSIEVVPVDTLASLFGDNTPQNPLLLTPGTSPFVADTVGFVDRQTGQTLAYFFNNAPGVNQWRRSASVSSFNDLPVYPDDAILVLRRQNRSSSKLLITGRVPTVAPLLKAAPGRAYFTTLGVPVDVTLNNLVFSGAWSRGASLFTGDTIGLHQPSTNRVIAHYQRNDLEGTWRGAASSLAPDVSSTVIPATSGIAILERSTTGVGAGSFNKFQLPYNVNN